VILAETPQSGKGCSRVILIEGRIIVSKIILLIEQGAV